MPQHGAGRTLPPSNDDDTGKVLVVDSTNPEGVSFAASGTAAYTPAVSGNWSPAPATVQAALDQLAARVKALE